MPTIHYDHYVIIYIYIIAARYMNQRFSSYSKLHHYVDICGCMIAVNINT